MAKVSFLPHFKVTKKQGDTWSTEVLASNLGSSFG